MMLEITRIRFVPEMDLDANGVYTAVCTEFGLAAMGETVEEARSELKATVASYCSALRRRGLIEAALRESGIDWQHVPVAAAAGELLVHVTPS
jgi:predicted RNase H-like HicB family nuclease